MVQPLWWRAGLVAFGLFVVAAPAAANAEPLAFVCGPGLVLDVDAEEADAIVRAICVAARERVSTGQVRVGLVGDGAGGARVTVARVADSSGAEQVARADVASVDDASRRGAAIVDALTSPPAAVQAPPSPPRASAPSLEPAPAPAPPPSDEAKPWPKKKPRRTFFPIGVTGVVAAPQSTLTAGDTPVLFGGGGVVGVEHDRVLTYAELLFAGGASSKVESRQTAFVLAARGALTATKLAPLLGGGFLLTSTHTDAREPARYASGGTYTPRSDDTTLDLFGEAGAALKLDDANRLVLLARLTPLASNKKATLDVGYLYAF